MRLAGELTSSGCRMSFSRRTLALFWRISTPRRSPFWTTAPFNTNFSPGLSDSLSGIWAASPLGPARMLGSREPTQAKQAWLTIPLRPAADSPRQSFFRISHVRCRTRSRTGPRLRGRRSGNSRKRGLARSHQQAVAPAGRSEAERKEAAQDAGEAEGRADGDPLGRVRPGRAPGAGGAEAGRDQRTGLAGAGHLPGEDGPAGPGAAGL